MFKPLSTYHAAYVATLQKQVLGQDRGGPKSTPRRQMASFALLVPHSFVHFFINPRTFLYALPMLAFDGYLSGGSFASTKAFLNLPMWHQAVIGGSLAMLAANIEAKRFDNKTLKFLDGYYNVSFLNENNPAIRHAVRIQKASSAGLVSAQKLNLF